MLLRQLLQLLHVDIWVCRPALGVWLRCIGVHTLPSSLSSETRRSNRHFVMVLRLTYHVRLTCQGSLSLWGLQAGPGVVAEVHRRAGDALYGRRDYGAAVAEYCETVGHLEPSYVIRRFLDAQRIHNLAAYLAHLHGQVPASPRHLTLTAHPYCSKKLHQHVPDLS